jgi:hypothetical protein
MGRIKVTESTTKSLSFLLKLFNLPGRARHQFVNYCVDQRRNEKKKNTLALTRDVETKLLVVSQRHRQLENERMWSVAVL